MMCEPLRGWRHVRVTERRTRRDWAECIRELVDDHGRSLWWTTTRGNEAARKQHAKRWRAKHRGVKFPRL